MNKKTFIANLNLFYYCIFIPLMYDFIVFIFLAKIKTIELAIILIIIICLLHSISFILGFKTISFKGEKIVYKKIFFQKQVYLLMTLTKF